MRRSPASKSANNRGPGVHEASRTQCESIVFSIGFLRLGERLPPRPHDSTAWSAHPCSGHGRERGRHYKLDGAIDCCRHPYVHGDFVSRWAHLHNRWNILHGDRVDERNGLHVHRDGE
jgi:hypothetical protein